jgi:GNAT superfamily N-acetyltransferase
VSEIHRVDAAFTRPLRQAVLRPHQRADELAFPGDDAADSWHGAAVEASGRNVGVASISREARPGSSGAGQWRIRGMAVVDDRRGQGIGAALLDAAIEHARRQGGSLVWCNARLRAVPFYRRHGFEVVGEPFEPPDIGVHYQMILELRSPSRTG